MSWQLLQSPTDPPAQLVQPVVVDVSGTGTTSDPWVPFLSVAGHSSLLNRNTLILAWCTPTPQPELYWGPHPHWFKTGYYVRHLVNFGCIKFCLGQHKLYTSTWTNQKVLFSFQYDGSLILVCWCPVGLKGISPQRDSKKAILLKVEGGSRVEVLVDWHANCLNDGVFHFSV